MLRLTPDDTDPARPVLRVEGRLDAATIPAMHQLLAGPWIPRAIDLTGLRSLDVEGRAFLLGLRAAGAQLDGASMFVRRLLGEA